MNIRKESVTLNEIDFDVVFLPTRISLRHMPHSFTTAAMDQWWLLMIIRVRDGNEKRNDHSRMYICV